MAVLVDGLNTMPCLLETTLASWSLLNVTISMDLGKPFVLLLFRLC